MNWRRSGFIMLTVLLLILSGMGGAKSAWPVSAFHQGDISATHNKQLPHKDPETIQQTVATGPHLLLSKKSGHPGWTDPEKATDSRIDSFTIH